MNRELATDERNFSDGFGGSHQLGSLFRRLLLEESFELLRLVFLMLRHRCSRGMESGHALFPMLPERGGRFLAGENFKRREIGFALTQGWSDARPVWADARAHAQ